MGKYMKKAKITNDVALMEVGVRTRAKTLALQKLQSSNPATSYLQLRSRRLEKILPPRPSPPVKNWSTSPGKSSNSGPWQENLGIVRANSSDGAWAGREFEGETGDWSVEPSFGENNSEFDSRERSTRESTPCSFIRAQVLAETPGSSTRQTSSTTTNQKTQSSNPTMWEIEEFLASAEKQQQRLFAEKYNFDVVNDVPLPGRYEWMRVDN